MTTLNGTKQNLRKVLADTYMLYLKTQNFHWNVEGRDFFYLHKAFQEQYEELTEAIDELAERLRALGEYAPGGMEVYSTLSTIADAPTPPPIAYDMLVLLAADHTAIIETIQKAIDVADDEGDSGTEDMLVARLQAHQKMLWMLKASLKKSA